MKTKKTHLLWQFAVFLISVGLGVLSVADKQYELYYLSAFALLFCASEISLTPHGVLLGQLSCLWGQGQAVLILPALICIYLLRLFFSTHRNRCPSPMLLSGILILYELFFACFSSVEPIQLILLLCRAVLSGCTCFFILFYKRENDTGNRRYISLCIICLFAMLLAESQYLQGVSLVITAVFIILYSARLALWQGILFSLFSLLAAPIGDQMMLIPFYLSAILSLHVMRRFGRYKYTGITVLCCELSLLLLGIWTTDPLLLAAAPVAAILYLLLPPPPRTISPTDEQLTDRFEALVKQVEQLQSAAGKRISFYPEIASRGTQLLREAGAENISVTCAKDLTGGFFINVGFEKGDASLSRAAVLGLMERACGFALSCRNYFSHQDKVYSCYIRRAPLSVQCAALCKTKQGETICGDSALAFNADQNHYVLLLSDGMGSGKEAFAQSCWTVTLLQKLLRAGLAAEGALGMVHSSLKLAQQDIAFATVDLCSIDLWQGKAQFIKAGAVSTYILRNDEIIEVCGISMPLGAVDSPDIAAVSHQLYPDDLILLISDGASECKDNVLYTLQKDRHLPIRELADQLMQSALSDTEGGDDDITVLVARLENNKQR